MKYWPLQWGIKGRVFLITAFPVMLMFILIVLWSRVTSHSAIQNELEERERRLIQKVNLVVEEERKHIALEIHDHFP